VTVPKFDEVKSMFVFGELFNEKSITLRVILRNAVGGRSVHKKINIGDGLDKNLLSHCTERRPRRSAMR
jgi:hypothetical protein